MTRKNNILLLSYILHISMRDFTQAATYTVIMVKICEVTQECKDMPVPIPPQPEWTITTAIKDSIFYALTIAAIAAISSKLPILNRLWSRGPAAEALDGAIVGGLFGGFTGFVRGAHRNSQYPLQVKSAMLENENAQLRAERSFAIKVLEGKTQDSPFQNRL